MKYIEPLFNQTVAEYATTNESKTMRKTIALSILSIVCMASHAQPQPQFRVNIGGIIGGVLGGVGIGPLTPESPATKLYLAERAKSVQAQEWEKMVADGQRGLIDFHESLEQWACLKAVQRPESIIPVNRFTLENIAQSWAVRAAPMGMTLEQCVTIIGGRVEDMDTIHKVQARAVAREEQQRLAKFEREQAAIRAQQLAKAEQDRQAAAKIEAERKAADDAHKWEEERPAREAAQKKAIEERQARDKQVAEDKQRAEQEKKNAIDSRKVALRSGKLAPASYEDFYLKYDNLGDGSTLAGAPKVKGDGRTYLVAGYLEQVSETKALMIAKQDTNDALASAFLRQHGAERNVPKYVILTFPRGAARALYQDTAKVNGAHLAIGKYVDNENLTLNNRSAMQAPVFEVIEFK